LRGVPGKIDHPGLKKLDWLGRTLPISMLSILPQSSGLNQRYHDPSFKPLPFSPDRCIPLNSMVGSDEIDAS